MRNLLTGLIGLLFSALPVDAATMTFDQAAYPYQSTYVENGITAMTADYYEIGVFGAGQVLHMDTFYQPSPQLVTFSMGRRFDAVSLLMMPSTFDYFVCDANNLCHDQRYANVGIRGYRGSSLVASLVFDMGSPSSNYTLPLGPLFQNLTSLVIEALRPDFLTGPDLYSDCIKVCAHFSIDDVTLAPVPLPASMPLATSGLATLALLGWRKRRTPAARQ
jgi:hypothetical protein